MENTVILLTRSMRLPFLIRPCSHAVCVLSVCLLKVMAVPSVCAGMGRRMVLFHPVMQLRDSFCQNEVITVERIHHCRAFTLDRDCSQFFKQDSSCVQVLCTEEQSRPAASNTAATSTQYTVPRTEVCIPWKSFTLTRCRASESSTSRSTDGIPTRAAAPRQCLLPHATYE